MCVHPECFRETQGVTFDAGRESVLVPVPDVCVSPSFHRAY